MSDYIRPDEWSDEDPAEGMPDDIYLAGEEFYLPTFSEIESEPVEWLVWGVVPRAEITIFAGNGGDGKTTTALKVIADLSQGKRTMFEAGTKMAEEKANFSRSPRQIIIFSGEDDPAKVLRPRLDLCGANFDNIRFMSATDKRFQDLNFSSQLLENLIKRYRPDLVLFDPWQSFLPAKANITARNEVRDLLDNLSNISGNYGTSFLVIVHANKGTGNYGRKRLADSADLWDKSRSVCLFGETGNPDGDGRLYCSQEKSNYGKRIQTLEFDLIQKEYSIKERTSYYSISVPVRWTDKHDRDYILGMLSEQNSRKSTSVETVKDLIITELDNAGRKMESAQLKDILINGVEVSINSFNRAKADLTSKGIIENVKSNSKNGRWYTVLK